MSPQVVADFNAGRDRFQRYYNPRLFAISWGVYDHYLKANGVRSGVVSYSRFVRLIADTAFDASGLPLRSAAFFGEHR